MSPAWKRLAAPDSSYSLLIRHRMVRTDQPSWRATASFPKGGRGVLRSNNGGLTRRNISTGLQNLDTTALAASLDENWLFVGTLNGGAHRLALRR